MRGISPSAQDKWLRGKPGPVPSIKSKPYRPIDLTPPARLFTTSLVLTFATGLAGRPIPRYLSSLGDKHLKPLDIVRQVAGKYGLSVTELKSRRRNRHIVYPRQEAMWRLRKETTLSLPQIGLIFGGFDHTTVLHACRAHEKRTKAV